MTDQVSQHPGIAQTLDPSQITQAEFVTAMVHLHRGELSEATAWRSRIDTTTNWAVVFSITTLSFVFSDRLSERHVLIPIVSVFCTFLLLMEARRYRFFDIWRSRARMIEINFYRPMLDGSTPTMGAGRRPWRTIWSGPISICPHGKPPADGSAAPINISLRFCW
jgi:uncharacterized membrane protein